MQYAVSFVGKNSCLTEGRSCASTAGASTRSAAAARASAPCLTIAEVFVSSATPVYDQLSCRDKQTQSVWHSVLLAHVGQTCHTAENSTLTHMRSSKSLVHSNPYLRRHCQPKGNELMRPALLSVDLISQAHSTISIELSMGPGSPRT